MSKIQKYVVIQAFSPTFLERGKKVTKSYLVGQEIDKTMFNPEQEEIFLKKGFIVKGDTETVKRIQSEDNTLIAFRKIVLVLKDHSDQEAVYSRINEEVKYFIGLYNSYGVRDVLPEQKKDNRDEMPPEKTEDIDSIILYHDEDVNQEIPDEDVNQEIPDEVVIIQEEKKDVNQSVKSQIVLQQRQSFKKSGK